MTARLTVAARTDPGRRRAENQDAILVRPIESANGTAYLLAVADGVGGGPGGRLASQQTMLALSDSAASYDLADPGEALRAGFQAANTIIQTLTQEKPDLAGMASTLAAAYVRDGQVWMANAGDSRIYLVREAIASPMTYDHSWVAEQVAAGKMTQEQAAKDQRRNLITRAVGIGDVLEPDLYQTLELEDGDYILLCSDGLYGVVEDDEIATICSQQAPDLAVDALVELANSRGGPDNISVVIAHWQQEEA